MGSYNFYIPLSSLYTQQCFTTPLSHFHSFGPGWEDSKLASAQYKARQKENSFSFTISHKTLSTTVRDRWTAHLLFSPITAMNKIPYVVIYRGRTSGRGISDVIEYKAAIRRGLAS